MSDIKSLTVRVGGPEGRVLQVKGRVAWTLDNLIRAGELGCTPIERPAPRWSDYVFKLKKVGFSIETIEERHAGTYSGRHGRYVLRSPVAVVAEVRQ